MEKQRQGSVGADTPASVSRIDCEILVHGKGRARIALYRHMAPLTVNALMRNLPLQSRANVQAAMVCMFSSVRVGVEKPRTAFLRGDLAFLASNALLCLFIKEASSDRPLNPIGKVEDEIHLFDSVRLGDVLELRRT